MCHGPRLGISGSPIAFKTVFGWVGFCSPIQEINTHHGRGKAGYRRKDGLHSHRRESLRFELA